MLNVKKLSIKLIKWRRVTDVRNGLEQKREKQDELFEEFCSYTACIQRVNSWSFSLVIFFAQEDL